MGNMVTRLVTLKSLKVLKHPTYELKLHTKLVLLHKRDGQGRE